MKTNQPRPKSAWDAGPPSLTRGDVLEIVNDLLRDALREQARELETHLNSIHERLVKLEPRRG